MIDIHNQDCLIGMQDIPDNSIDFICTDLPYGTTRNKWDSIILLPDFWEQANRVIKDNGCIALFGQQPFTTVLNASNLNDFRYELIWEKETGTGHLNAKKMPMKSHETISIFYKRLPTYNPQMEAGKAYTCKKGGASSNYNADTKDNIITKNNGTRYPKSVLKFARDKGGKHPTQKPVTLLEWLIKTYTNTGETVLDATMGSGTCGVAAVNTGRSFVGFELNKEYFDIALERIISAQDIRNSKTNNAANDEVISNLPANDELTNNDKQLSVFDCLNDLEA